jgi:hypothetical protein
LQHHALAIRLVIAPHFVNALQYLEISAGFRQREWSTPVEQAYAEFVLKLLHLAAERWLRNVELFRGATE